MRNSGNRGTSKREWQPAAVYAGELKRLAQVQGRAQRRERALGYTKLLLAGGTLVLAAFLLRRGPALFLLIVPVLAFLVLAVLQEKLIGAIRYRQRAIAFYERGMARLEDRWKGSGETGERFLDPEHPYARDLDLFGDASLFQYLATARTRAGEERLARWMLHAADPEEIAARQESVKELEERVRLREQLASGGETVRQGVHPEALAAWGEAEPVLSSAGRRIAVSAMGMLWIASLVAWPVFGLPEIPLLMTLVNFAYAHRIHAPLERAAGALENAAADLQLLAQVLALMERETVAAAKLTELRSALQSDGIAPSVAIRRLARVVELIESRHSLFAKPLDLVTFWSAQLVFVAETWQRHHGPAIRRWLSAVGEFEALSALAGYAWEHPEYAYPELVAGEARDEALLDAEELAHPLLPGATAVANDVALGAQMQAILLSGPNMAGKSTFMRAVGVNAVLAQCGAPVRARRMRMSRLQVAASICVLDSLAGGISRFYAEIRRIKVIADLAQGPRPVLFLLDELLSGTNSHDRLIGTEFIVRELLALGALGIVSTHDLALTRIPEMVAGRAANFHFEDRIEDGRLIFDYKLKPGVVQTSNALKLMQAIGLGVRTEEQRE